MRRPATIQDLMDLMRGHLFKGAVYHDCGGKMRFEFGMDAFHCSGCQTRWARQWVKERTNTPFAVTYWIPPMEITDEND